MKKIASLLLFSILILQVSKTHSQTTGHFVTKSRITIDKASKPFSRFVGDSIHFWYRHKAIITQIIAWSGSDSAGIRKEWDEPLRYIFFDIKNKQFYEYKHFADTAKLITSYKEPEDSAHDIPFRMYSRYSSLPMKDEIVNKGINLSDTTINSKVYQRYRFNMTIIGYDNQPYLYTYTMYFDCKSKGPIQFHKALGDKHGCPITRYDEEVNTHYAIIELLPISKTLTAEENKVFDAWEKYAKEHPVK